MDSEIAKNGDSAQVDILSWLSRMTLDVIGLAGFNYRFDSLNPHAPPNELSGAFEEMFNPSGARLTLFIILKNIFPILEFLVSYANLLLRSPPI